MNTASLIRTMCLFAGVFGHLAGAQTVELPEAKVTVVVKDQDGKPVEGAQVGIGGTMSTRPGTVSKGATDVGGMFTAQVRSNGEVGITVRKAGYYDSFGPDYNFRNIAAAIEKAFAKKRWEPWNPNIEVILKRVINPAAMYARGVTKGLPSTSEATAFDLVEGDFVHPHGRGKVSDLIFAPDLKDRGADDYDFQLTVKFSNPKDGIVPFAVLPPLTGSVLRSPHQAPDGGYLAEWMVWRSRRPAVAESSNYDPDNHAYFIRVRTVVDEKGNIVSANYGKIYGDFMRFTYYLNPKPRDRNVEFDPARNLIKNLLEAENVIEP